MPSGSRFDKVGLKQKTKILAPTYHSGRLALVLYKYLSEQIVMILLFLFRRGIQGQGLLHFPIL